MNTFSLIYACACELMTHTRSRFLSFAWFCVHSEFTRRVFKAWWGGNISIWIDSSFRHISIIFFWIFAQNFCISKRWDLGCGIFVWKWQIRMKTLRTSPVAVVDNIFMFIRSVASRRLTREIIKNHSHSNISALSIYSLERYAIRLQFLIKSLIFLHDETHWSTFHLMMFLLLLLFVHRYFSSKLLKSSLAPQWNVRLFPIFNLNIYLPFSSLWSNI